MPSLRRLRELISERLTAAAEEIFTHVENIIVEYEEEVDRQRKLLEIVSKPRVRLHRIELPQRHVENEQQVCNQEWNSSLDQEEPESLQIKEAPKEICTNQEQEHLEIKEEAHTLRNITELSQQHVYNEEEVLTEQQLWNEEWNSSLDQEEPDSLQIKEDKGEICTSQEQFELKEEADTFTLTPDNEESDHMEPDTDHQLLSPVAETQDQTVHMRNITGERPHMCSFCEKSFRWKYSLIRHIRIHTGLPVKDVLQEEEEEVLTEQQLCNQERNSRLDQEEPQSLQIKEEEEEICTSQEQEQLKLKEEADPFMLTPDNEESDHMEPEPDTDHQLLSPVAESQDQTVQRKNITGEKPHMCNFCNKCFTYTHSLKCHMKTHTGGRPHICDICEKCFVQKSSLMYHMRTHTGDKPHMCKICKKCFTRNDKLTKHMRTHTGERPFSCECCGKRFRQLAHLTSHIRTHTSDKSHICNVCKRRFARSDTLMRHMKSRHS